MFTVTYKAPNFFIFTQLFYCWVLWGLLKLDQSSLSCLLMFPLREDRGNWISPCFLSWPEGGRWFGPDLPRKCDYYTLKGPKHLTFPGTWQSNHWGSCQADSTARYHLHYLPSFISNVIHSPSLDHSPSQAFWELPISSGRYFICFNLQRRTLLNLHIHSFPLQPTPTQVDL